MGGSLTKKYFEAGKGTISPMQGSLDPMAARQKRRIVDNGGIARMGTGA